MLLQANDFVQLNRLHGCGVADRWLRQWGIIVPRRPGRGCRRHRAARDDRPAVTASDGTKFRQVHRWREPVARPGDDEPLRLVPVLREHRRRRRRALPAVVHLLEREEIDELEKRHRRVAASLAAAQKRLAAEMTTLVHGAEQTAAVDAASQALFRTG